MPVHIDFIIETAVRQSEEIRSVESLLIGLDWI